MEWEKKRTGWLILSNTAIRICAAIRRVEIEDQELSTRHSWQGAERRAVLESHCWLGWKEHRFL